jgi:hypothetical protein
MVAPKKNIATDNDIFFPKQRDQLFWCLYIILHGQIEYDMLTNFFTLEKETKYKSNNHYTNNISLQ